MEDSVDISQFLSVYVSVDDTTREEPLGSADLDPLAATQEEMEAAMQRREVNDGEIFHPFLGPSFADDVSGNTNQCPYCFKVMSRGKINVHIRTHTGEKPYVCDVCGKSFSRSDKLQQHKRIHTGEKPYVCFCAKRFNRIDHLKMHAMTHNVSELQRTVLLEEAKQEDLRQRGITIPLTKTPPYTCPICYMQFGQSYKYKRHLRIHTGEKPYVCFCGAKYARSERLRKHQIEIHGCELGNNATGQTMTTAQTPDADKIMSAAEPDMKVGTFINAIETDLNVKFTSSADNKVNSRSPIEFNVKSNSTLEEDEEIKAEKNSKESQPKIDTTVAVGNAEVNVPNLRSKVEQRGKVNKFLSAAEPDMKANVFKPENNLSTTEQPVKRRRGRPRKHPLPVGAEPVASKQSVKVSTKKPVPYLVENDEANAETVSQSSKKNIRINGLFSCEYCSKTFKKSHKLIIHKRVHTGEKPHTCESCGKAFARKDHMMKHLNIHLKRRRDTYLNNLNQTLCDFMGDDYPDIKIEYEEVNKVPEIEYPCEICGHSFRRISNLQTHMAIHSERTLFNCGICYKEFKVKKNYEAHILNHEETESDLVEKAPEITDFEKVRHQRAQCPVCGKWLVSPSSLETHMRSHTGERPFKCDECDNKFIRKADMIRHMKSHTGEKPYKCCYCSQMFSRKDKHSFHVKKHEESLANDMDHS